ncbi:MAG: site-specific integrase [Bacillota bacterium]|nr:site-specific integrase [Bacillota bacterium]
MAHPFSLGTIAWQRLHAGPLASHVEAFAKRLHERGYAGFTGRVKLRLVADFSRWLERRGLLAAELNGDVIAKYLTHRRRCGAVRLGDPETLRDLLSLLQEAGAAAAAPPQVDESPAARVVRDFGQYLAQERGLSQATLNNSLPVVRRFLDKRFSDQPVLLDELRAPDVTGFVLRNAHTLSPGCAKLMVGALRSFFRYLRLRGDIDIDLAGVVPSVAEWRFSTLPRSLDAEDVERLLMSCDQGTPTGQRDYAILLLLARLGLRSGEVVALTLDDIDWESGELTVRGKGGRGDRLPIPRDVGKAIATYLRHGRPACSTRRVFVRIKAPRGGFSRSQSVGCVVKRALARADLNPPHKGAHLLRHSLATQMLAKGASLAEIGELLRHRLPDTTAIYAKVDLAALHDLALPWPGGEA